MLPLIDPDVIYDADRSGKIFRRHEDAHPNPSNASVSNCILVHML